MNNETKRGSWFKWIVGTIIALIGTGGGLVALLQYWDAQQEEENKQYQQALASWGNFSPQSISRGVQKIELRGLDRFDLDTGRKTSAPSSNLKWDLLFGCWPRGYESLRASDGVKWIDLGLVNFSAIRYREIRDARYNSPPHSKSGKKDLYYAHKSNVPGGGYTFAVRTADNHVAKVQIVSYRSVDPNPEVCRNVSLQYEIYPIVQDPPKPRRP